MQQRYIVPTLLILLLFLAGGGQAMAQPITARPDTIDFGLVRPYKAAKAIIDTLYVGASGIPVIIDSVSISGTGFFISQSISGPREVRSDSTILLRVEFTPSSGPGRYSGTVRVHYRVQQLQPEVLSLVVRGIAVRPSAFVNEQNAVIDTIDFGRHPVGSRQDTAIFIRNNDSTVSLPLHSNRIAGDIAQAFQIRVSPSALGGRIDPLNIDTIGIRFTPSSVGVYTALYILEDSTGSDTLRLRGEGIGANPDSSISPKVLDFGTVERDSCRTIRFMLHNTASLPLPIDSALLQSSANQTGRAFTLDSAVSDTLLAAHDSLAIYITYCAQRSGCDTAALLLISAGRQISIPVRACAGDREIRVVDTASSRIVEIDFGIVDTLFSSKSRKYFISNPGSFDVRVTGQRLAIDTNFHLTQKGSSLVTTVGAGNSSAPFEIVFQPQKTGTLYDTLIITSSATTVDSIIRIPLVGTARVPQNQLVWDAPQEVDFGDVHRWHDSIIAVPLKNVSSTPVTVQGIKVANNFGDVGFGFNLKSDTTLNAGETLILEISFSPKQVGAVSDELIVNQNSATSLSIRLRGNGVSDSLVIDSVNATGSEIRFKPTSLGESSEQVVRVINTGNIPATVDAGTMTGSTAFTIVSTPTVNVGQRDSITIRYTPNDAQPDTAYWVSTNPGVSLRLVGNPIVSYFARFDATSGNAGDLIPLHLLIEPGLITSQNLTGFTAHLHVEPTALFAEQAVNAAGKKISLTRDTLGTITVEESVPATPANLRLQGDTLCTIYFRGLTTGRAQNIVSFDSLSFTGASIPLDSLGNGLIFLSGCNVGRTEPLARRSRISGLKTSARDNQAELTYRAAAGAPVRVRIIDLHGQLLRTMELPDGTGEDQTVAISLIDLPPGLLFLELRVVNDHATMPLILVQ